MDSFQRDGLTFDVRDGGPSDGDAVLLLHGFPQDSTAWDGVARALHRDGWRTLAPDQRGYSPGARPRGRRHYRLREVVEDAVALLDAARLGSAHVAGHDWGAAVAWGLAAWHPERVRTLTALSVPHPSAMARAAVTSDQALRSAYIGMFQLPLLPEQLLLAGGGAGLARGLRRAGLPRPAAEHYAARMAEPGAMSAALGWYRAMPWGAGESLGVVRVPTLQVWSSGDRFIGRAAIEACRRFVDAPYRVEVLDDVPHWIPELEPERVARLVTAHARGS